jgi:flagellar biosynthesis anti-sigma factor FlgM
MKVDGSPKVLGPTRVRPTPGTDATPSPSSGKDADVQLSNLSRELTAARSPETPDGARIERLREAIAQGSFRVDPDEIARTMLDEEAGR